MQQNKTDQTDRIDEIDQRDQTKRIDEQDLMAGKPVHVADRVWHSKSVKRGQPECSMFNVECSIGH
jgi:hypothetical protein